MTKLEILEFIKEAKELGLKSIEIEGVKVEFGEPSQPVEVNAVEPEELTAKDLMASLDKFEEISEEEILFWSSDYGLELEAQRKREKEESIARRANVVE